MFTLTGFALERAGAWPVAAGYAIAGMAVVLFLRLLKTAPAAAWFVALIALSMLPVVNLVPIPSRIVAPYKASMAGLGVAALIAWAVFGFMARFAGKRPLSLQAVGWAAASLYIIGSAGLSAWS